MHYDYLLYYHNKSYAIDLIHSLLHERVTVNWYEIEAELAHQGYPLYGPNSVCLYPLSTPLVTTPNRLTGRLVNYIDKPYFTTRISEHVYIHGHANFFIIRQSMWKNAKCWLDLELSLNTEGILGQLVLLNRKMKVII